MNVIYLSVQWIVVFLNRKAHNNGSKFYLIVDEYDNFTNVVLNEQGNDVYYALTHASDFYREVFKKFKDKFDRSFITGYIIELKYLSAKDSEEKAEAQWHAAVTQIKNPQFPRCAKWCMIPNCIVS